MMQHRLARLAADRRGMSVTEVLAACGLIGTGLVALLSIVPTAGYGLQEGRQLSTATFLANQRLEQVRNAAWTASPALDCLGTSASSSVAPTSSTCIGPGLITTFPDEAALAAPYADYARTVRITDCSLGGGCGGILSATLRQVVVTVSYRPSTGAGVAASGITKSAIVSLLVAQH